MAEALHAHFGISRERVAVLYPGYSAARYSLERAAELRRGARSALRVEPPAPARQGGASSNRAKRGLDLFLDSAARIASMRPDTRFLVVGSKELPEHARTHALVRRGVVLFRPKSLRPERWFAALDLFLYAARASRSSGWCWRKRRPWACPS